MTGLCSHPRLLVPQWRSWVTTALSTIGLPHEEADSLDRTSQKSEISQELAAHAGPRDQVSPCHQIPRSVSRNLPQAQLTE